MQRLVSVVSSAVTESVDALLAVVGLGLLAAVATACAPVLAASQVQFGCGTVPAVAPLDTVCAPQYRAHWSAS